MKIQVNRSSRSYKVRVRTGPKRYTLNINDILQIPEERFDDFLLDLKLWHGAVRNMKKFIDVVAEVEGHKVKTEATQMIWIDDGKHDGKIIINGKEKGSL